MRTRIILLSFAYYCIYTLWACVDEKRPEPKFCWICYELNIGGSKSNYTFGDGYTKVCDKEPANEFYEYWTQDSVYHYHKFTCIKDTEHVN